MTMQTATTSMPRLIRDVDEARQELTRRRGFEEPDLSPRMQEGIRRVFGADLSADEVVDCILSDVRNEGDAAVLRYSAAFDGEASGQLEIPRSAWKSALAQLEPALQDALRLAAEQIATFHRKQLRTSWLDYSDDG
jgi:histidinol dehydrogenase